MKRSHALLTFLLGTVLITSTGCIGSPTNEGWMEKAAAQTAFAPRGWKSQQVARLSLQTPTAFVQANQRLDVGLRELPEDIRAKIVSYESWDADADAGAWKVVVNRITYTKGLELNLDEATKGTVEDITSGLENACKPHYQITSQLVVGLPGRYLSLSCDLPNEGPVYVEAVIFSDNETLWQVQVAFADKAKLAEAKEVLQSVKLNQTSQNF